MTTTPTTPPPATPGPPAPKKPLNKIGRAAFLCAIGAFAIGCYGYAGFFTWLPAIVGIALAIIAVTRPNLPHGMAIAALIIGAIAVFSGPITAVTHVVSDAAGNTNTNPVAAAASDSPAASAPADEPSEEPSEEQSAKPTPDDTVKTKTYTGSGDKVLHVNYDVPVVASFSCSGCSSNTAVKTDSGMNSLIVNTIGGYSGRHLLNTSDGDLLTRFVISADARWKLKITDLRNAKIEHVAAGSTVRGKGDDVIAVDQGVSDSDVKNIGDGNFALNSYGGSDSLPVNEIGSYKGNVVLDGPAVVQVESDGSWTIKGNG